MDLNTKIKLRPLAREKAAWFSSELDKVADRKGNIHQASIDLSDELEVFIHSLPDDERDMFRELFTEELEANTAEKNRKAEELLEEAEAIQTEYKAAGTVVGAVILFFVLLIIFSSFM